MISSPLKENNPTHSPYTSASLHSCWLWLFPKPLKSKSIPGHETLNTRKFLPSGPPVYFCSLMLWLTWSYLKHEKNGAPDTGFLEGAFSLPFRGASDALAWLTRFVSMVSTCIAHILVSVATKVIWEVISWLLHSPAILVTLAYNHDCDCTTLSDCLTCMCRAKDVHLTENSRSR